MHNFNNLSIKFHEIMYKMLYGSCSNNRCTEIKMCDLKLFFRVYSDKLFTLINPLKFEHFGDVVYSYN